MARAGLGLSNSGGGARRGRPGAGRGYYGSFAEPPRTGPSRHRPRGGDPAGGRDRTVAAGGRGGGLGGRDVGGGPAAPGGSAVSPGGTRPPLPSKNN